MPMGIMPAQHIPRLGFIRTRVVDHDLQHIFVLAESHTRGQIETERNETIFIFAIELLSVNAYLRRLPDTFSFDENLFLFEGFSKFKTIPAPCFPDEHIAFPIMAAFHEIIERINIIERMRCAFSQSEPSNFGSYAFRTSAKYLFDKR